MADSAAQNMFKDVIRKASVQLQTTNHLSDEESKKLVEFITSHFDDFNKVIAASSSGGGGAELEAFVKSIADATKMDINNTRRIAASIVKIFSPRSRFGSEGESSDTASVVHAVTEELAKSVIDRKLNIPLITPIMATTDLVLSRIVPPAIYGPTKFVGKLLVRPVVGAAFARAKQESINRAINTAGTITMEYLEQERRRSLWLFGITTGLSVIATFMVCKYRRQSIVHPDGSTHLASGVSLNLVIAKGFIVTHNVVVAMVVCGGIFIIVQRVVTTVVYFVTATVLLN